MLAQPFFKLRYFSINGLDFLIEILIIYVMRINHLYFALKKSIKKSI